MLEWSLEALGAVCHRVVAAVPAGHEEAPDRVRGGASRSESVLAALDAAPEASVAVVHDAARPLVTPDLVRRCVDALDGVDGAFAAARVTDTVHKAGGDGLVSATPERSRLWAAQTPQVFRAEALRAALNADPDRLAAATDEVSLVAANGGSVRVVEMQEENLKVTTALDLRMAESLLASRA